MRPFPLFMMWASGVGVGSILETGVEGAQTVGMVLGVAVCTVAGLHSAAKGSPAREEGLSLEEQVEAELERREARPFTKWSEVAAKLNHQFKLAKIFGCGVRYNNVGCISMYEVIHEMGRCLDKAVDNAWAELPPAELLEKVRNLEASDAAHKDE